MYCYTEIAVLFNYSTVNMHDVANSNMQMLWRSATVNGSILFYWKIKKKKIVRRPRSVARELIPCRPLSRQGWNSVKLAYKLAGWPAQLPASAFNQPGQYVTSPGGHRPYCYAELAVFFPNGSHSQNRIPTLPVLISPTHRGMTTG